MGTKLIVKEVDFSYGSHRVLKGVTFTAKPGEYLYILGPNGVGKSTLFRNIMGHLSPSTGEILVGNQPMKQMSANQLSKKIAYIPQKCTPSFDYSVIEIAAMGRAAYLSIFSSPSQKDYDHAKEVLDSLGIGHLASCGVNEISGGEMQLVIIARALVQEADILIMDEPTSNLDYGNQIRVQEKMKELSQRGMTVIQSSHNPQYAMFFADKVGALMDGKIVAFGTPKEVITRKTVEELYKLKVDIKEQAIIPKII